MRKFITLLIFFIMAFAQNAFADEVYKVTSVNFDTSNSFVFLTSSDNTQNPIATKIKLVKLDNPRRAYFDINSAILSTKAQDWYLNQGGVKHVKVSQFSVNPNVVRVVMYFEENFNIDSNIKLLRMNNNIMIKYKNVSCDKWYFQKTYRDTHSSSSDYYQYLNISSQDLSKTVKNVASKSNSEDKIVDEIQKAFNTSVVPKGVENAPVVVQKKDLNMKSGYYLNSITVKPEGLLIGGYGSVMVERPMILSEPSRVVFDMPNTYVNEPLRNKEIKLVNSDSLKIGQFTTNKARLVITTKEPNKYIPVFPFDNQTMMIASADKLNPKALFTSTSDAISYYTKKSDKDTDEFIIAFNRPVIHSIRREANKITIYLFNVSRYNDQAFQNAVKNTNLKKMKAFLLPQVGMKIELPLENDSIVETFLGTDAKSIELKVKNALPKNARVTVAAPVVAKPVVKKKTSGKSVTLDAGHGGQDYGAIRAGINEKDINLDVAKRVEAILKKAGYSVKMTRNEDIGLSLQERVDISEGFNSDVFVSIHVNSSTKNEPNGIETHYYHDYSMKLAEVVHSKMAGYIQAADRGLFKSKFYVINHTTAPAILVEIGFISNDNERAQLVSDKRKQTTAKAIAEGIIEYLKSGK